MEISKDNLDTIIKNEVLKLSENFEQIEKNSEDILQELANSIGQIDFKILAFPDIIKLENEIEALKPLIKRTKQNLRNIKNSINA